jgi:hypothetical protein
MIVASPKSVTELKQLIDRHQKVLFVGCATCVTVCLAGGEREVGIAGYGVRMARKLAKQPSPTRHRRRRSLRPRPRRAADLSRLAQAQDGRGR